VRIEVYHHFPTGHGSTALLDVLRSLNTKVSSIMVKQADFEVKMNELADQAEKDKAEIVAATAVATQAIADLQAALEAAGDVSPGILAAFDRAKAAVQGIDDLNADAPPPAV
jgi:peptidoglycan hydrolase CwlO-like protein